MRHRRKRRRVRRYTKNMALALVLLAAVWSVGFFAFLDKIPRDSAQPDGAGKADAIVVLTGGAGRLELGLRLLADGHAEKLFISGVDAGVDKLALLQNRQIDAATLDCCIALGHSANDTFGNATETAVWMVSEGYVSLYVVTANYHMPRSLIEFRAALPTAELRPQAVHPGNVHLEDWWRWPGTIRLLAVEYTKYLATRVRVLLS